MEHRTSSARTSGPRRLCSQRLRMPERLASVIVGEGGAAVPLQLGEPLASWVTDPDLDKYRQMDPRAIVNAAVDGITGGVPDEVRNDYLDCYDGDRFVESMRYVRRYPEELPVLAELLPTITTPVTIINGRHDSVVPLANVEFLDETAPPEHRRDHRRQPLRLGGGADRVRRDRPRRDWAELVNTNRKEACRHSTFTRRPPRRPNSSSPASPTSGRAGRSSFQTAPTTISRCIPRAPRRLTSQKVRAGSGSACTTTGRIPTTSS